MQFFLMTKLLDIRICLFNVLFATPKQFNKKLDPQLIMTDFELAIEEANRLEVYVSSTLSTIFD